MCSLMKYVHFKVELSKGREARTLHSTKTDTASFLEWTGYQIRSSTNMPVFEESRAYKLL